MAISRSPAPRLEVFQDQLSTGKEKFQSSRGSYVLAFPTCRRYVDDLEHEISAGDLDLAERDHYDREAGINAIRQTMVRRGAR